MKVGNVVLVSAGCVALAASLTMGAEHPGTDAELSALVERATQAHESLMRGDIDAYRRNLELSEDFTLMDPFGGKPTGKPRSEEHWQRIGRLFRDGSGASFETISAYRADDLAVLVAEEHAHVAVGELPAQQWSLRVTLVFRREEGVWRLAHRHADPLARGVSLAQAGAIALGGAR